MQISFSGMLQLMANVDFLETKTMIIGRYDIAQMKTACIATCIFIHVSWFTQFLMIAPLCLMLIYLRMLLFQSPFLIGAPPTDEGKNTAVAKWLNPPGRPRRSIYRYSSFQYMLNICIYICIYIYMYVYKTNVIYRYSLDILTSISLATYTISFHIPG